jgi:hypothetical protein
MPAQWTRRGWTLSHHLVHWEDYHRTVPSHYRPSFPRWIPSQDSAMAFQSRFSWRDAVGSGLVPRVSARAGGFL